MQQATERYADEGGRRYRLMTLADFRHFRDVALSDGPEWATHYSDEVLTVQSKPPGDNSTILNIIRVRRVMEKVPPLVLYNQLHDAKYRETWDKNMIEGYNIIQLDPHNDIGYYSAKFVWPLANRDFCNMRSWMEFTNGEFIIFNHSEPHSQCPEKKGFVRARSILTGFYMRPHNGGTGTELIYITHSDPCGSIPHSIINFSMTKLAPKILDNCEKCSEMYPQWAATAYPAGYEYPWRTPKMDWDSPYQYPEDAIQAESKAAAASATAVPSSSLDGAAVGGQKPGIASEGTAKAPGQLGSAGATVSGSVLQNPDVMGPSVSLAPMPPPQQNDALAIQQYLVIMQDAMNAVDRSFLRESRVPSTTEYLVRLKYMLEGIRRTASTPQ